MKISTIFPALLLTIFLQFYSPLLKAQNLLPRESISIDFGYSKHGTGDMPGFLLNTEYRNYFKKRLFYAIGLGASWHDGLAEALFFTAPSGRLTDASIRNLTAGFQLSAKAGLDFLQADRHSLALMLGPLLRYQSTTVPDIILTLYPPYNGLSFPVSSLAHYEKQRTVSLGGVVQLSYRYAFSAKIAGGINSGFQTDTNGDAILQLGGSLAIRL